MSLNDHPGVTYAHCVVETIGYDTTCPMCDAPVKSGQRHECSKPKQKENDEARA